MKEAFQTGSGLVTVVITTYNQARYLDDSITSVLSQSYSNIEVIVVDDGSVDHAREVVAKYPAVQYIYQKNQGISAARNTGIDQSKGDYLVFLDADDFLLENALITNIGYLQKNKALAFVSGDHIKVDKHKNQIEDYKRELVTDNHYCYLLHHNYIEMFATIMFQRWVFDKIRYDVSLKACEDYEVLLKVVRSYPVLHHQHLLAAYRKHGENMTRNIPLIMETGIEVMNRQKPYLTTPEEMKWSQSGIFFWKDNFGRKIYRKLRRSPYPTFSKEERYEIATLYKYHRALFFKYLTLFPFMSLKHALLTKAKPTIRHLASMVGLYKRPIPAQGKIRRGDFNRTKPFSKIFGYDRGGPIDRYYIENFLQQESASIKGRVLEIGDNEYTLRFGGDKVTQSDVLHINDSNPKATIVGDLSNAPQLPSDSFDCIVLTETLHLIYDFKAALQTCYRILKPGGTLLLTVPGIRAIDRDEWKDIWFWSFTEASIKKLFAELYPSTSFITETHGNVLVATSFLYGLGRPELKKEELDYKDPHYPVTVTAVGHKPQTA